MNPRAKPSDSGECLKRWIYRYAEYVARFFTTEYTEDTEIFLWMGEVNISTRFATSDYAPERLTGSPGDINVSIA